MRNHPILKRMGIIAMLLIFLFTSLLPTPIYAAEMVTTSFTEKRTAVVEASSSLLLTAEESSKGAWNSLVDFFTDRDEEKAKAEEIADETLYQKEEAPVGEKIPKAEKVKEDTSERDQNSKVFELSDGRKQKEISADPVHYKDEKGKWQEIDVNVKKTKQKGFNYENTSNTFRTYFGTSSSTLLRFEHEEKQIDFNPVAVQANVKPTIKENQVTYVQLWDKADLIYDVGTDSLKETIRLNQKVENPTYTFHLNLKGLQAKDEEDGSIRFEDRESGRVVYRMPKPFMMDATPDENSPYGFIYSENVKQSVKQEGDQATITIEADPKWIADQNRKFPILIDPTIKIEPTPTESVDAYIASKDPNYNTEGTWRLKAGTSDNSIYRALVKFDLSSIPKQAILNEATLSMYYDQEIDTTSGSHSVSMSAHQVTRDWDVNNVTWNQSHTGINWGSAGGSYNTTPISYYHAIDNESTYTSKVGNWPLSSSVSGSYHGTYAPNNPGQGKETFTYVPHFKEDGVYELQIFYTSSSDRATNTPYTVHYEGGRSQTVRVNQQKNGSRWVTIGYYPFEAGSSHKVVISDDANGYVIADGIRFVKRATATKTANANNTWNHFGVRELVQKWLDGTAPNYGFLLRAQDETLGKGGPIYTASQNYDESSIRPRLTVIYDEPSVSLTEPTTVYATGADLKWSKYTEDDFVEYQVHRSVYQDFVPDESTLVAPIDNKYQLNYTDTTADPTPADDPDPLGNAYYYMIAVKTKSGELKPGASVLTRLPKAGMALKVFQNPEEDTTISKSKPTMNLNTIEGKNWLMVGTNSGTYGTTRALMRFNIQDIPKGAKIVNASLNLWGWYRDIDGGSSDATYALHTLTKAFYEGSATWNTSNANFDSATLDTVSGITNDPKWRVWNATQAVDAWHTGTKTNYGFMLKLLPGSLERTLFLSNETKEKTLRPKLKVIYTLPTAENTYHAPETPADMVVGDNHEVLVTITNTTDRIWKKGDEQLTYRWSGDQVPQGTDRVNLPKDVKPGEAVQVKAQIHAPVLQTKAYRETRNLEWDIVNQSGEYLSKSAQGIPALQQAIVVQSQKKAEHLGYEPHQGLIGKYTGAGTDITANLFYGNTMFSYSPFSNPSKGFDTNPTLTYNSLDASDSLFGPGWSFALTNMMRVGTPANSKGVKIDHTGKILSGTVLFIDGDGTKYTFVYDTKTKKFKSPKGSKLHLILNSMNNKTYQWRITTQDGTYYYFDSEGYISRTIDRNGFKMDYVYEKRSVGNLKVKFLKYLKDHHGRRTIAMEYYGSKDTSDPDVLNQVKSMTDISGLKFSFTYNHEGYLTKITEGDGKTGAKVYQFSYEQNRMRTITDPRGNISQVYYDDGGHATKIIDREGKETHLEYRTSADDAENAITVVTDAKNRKSVYKFNNDGRPIEYTNDRNETDKFGWDEDRNLIRKENANGAVTTWTYDDNGYMLTQTDAMNNAISDVSKRKQTKMEYDYHLDGHVADLKKVTSPEGHVSTYTYDQMGNLLTVTAPKGNATATAGDYTTKYTYQNELLASITDAKGNKTTYSNYGASGLPEKVTNALGKSTTVSYGLRGEVLTVVDPDGNTGTYTYDSFLRPLTSTMPVDKATGRKITIPAPVYDANDNILETTTPTGVKTTYSYNKNDWVMQATLPSDTTNGAKRLVTYEYDHVGNLIKETQPKGNLTSEDPDDYATQYLFDQLHRIAKVINSEGHTLSYEYDNVGNLVKVTEPKGNETEAADDYSTTYAYDLNGRLTKETDTLGNSVHFTYDHDGNPVKVTDEEGNITEASYDENGQLTAMRTPHDQNVVRTTQYKYDTVGNLTETITPRGVATSTEGDYVHKTVYDKLNRVQEIIYPRDPNSSNAREREEHKLQYTYDNLSRITEISAPASSGQTKRNVTKVDYFDNGWIKQTTDPHGIQAKYAYNDLGQTTQYTLNGEGGAEQREQNWTYYPDGKVKTETERNSDQTTLIIDNADATKVEQEGDWGASSPNSDKYHGTNYLVNENVTGSFTWKLNVPAAGDYEVYIKNVYHQTRSKRAPFSIIHAKGTSYREVDQSNPDLHGEWVNLGSYSFSNAQTGKVTLTGSASGSVVADAVKLVKNDRSVEVNLKEAQSSGKWQDGSTSYINEKNVLLNSDMEDAAYLAPDGWFELVRNDEGTSGIVHEDGRHMLKITTSSETAQSGYRILAQD
ncbi:DNRLRE domain-containing protein, partial [Hazenella sp. IB182357]